MNSVELRTRVCGDHLVVALRAELDICKAAATIAAIAGRGPGRAHSAIVDLHALDFIYCAALRALARAQQQARQAGGQGRCRLRGWCGCAAKQRHTRWPRTSRCAGRHAP
jgi:anti-anti-sigma factor